MAYSGSWCTKEGEAPGRTSWTRCTVPAMWGSSCTVLGALGFRWGVSGGSWKQHIKYEDSNFDWIQERISGNHMKHSPGEPLKDPASLSIQDFARSFPRRTTWAWCIDNTPPLMKNYSADARPAISVILLRCGCSQIPSSWLSYYSNWWDPASWLSLGSPRFSRHWLFWIYYRNLWRKTYYNCTCLIIW